MIDSGRGREGDSGREGEERVRFKKRGKEKGRLGKSGRFREREGEKV